MAGQDRHDRLYPNENLLILIINTTSGAIIGQKNNWLCNISFL